MTTLAAATPSTGPAPAPTEQVASKSSFYAGMRILPKAEREAMFAVYGFCRIVDDIADDQTLPLADQRKRLDQWRRDLDALYAGGDAGQAAFHLVVLAQRIADELPDTTPSTRRSSRRPELCHRVRPRSTGWRQPAEGGYPG